MKKVLWFSRHKMTAEQENDLRRIYGEIHIRQIDKTIETAKELEKEITESDVIAIVAPDDLKQEFFALASKQGKPLLESKNKRVFDGEKYQFVFDGWYRIKKIIIEKEKL